MNLKGLYEKAVAVGMESDPRGPEAARAMLSRNRKEFEGQKDAERPYFDPERLGNPYDDTRILNGPVDRELKSIMVGIDIGEGELVLADRLREKGQRVDAVIGHHPHGLALAGLPFIMAIQPGIYAAAGVPIGQAEGALEARIKEVASRVSPVNQQRSADAARLLGIPFACFHTVADNCVASHLTGLFRKEAPKTLADLLDLLHAIPEYDLARRQRSGPEIVCGSRSSTTGKILVEMTGGTEGASQMYAKLARSTDVSTLVGMHFSKEHLDAAKAENLNVVIAGHISSDNLGLNLLFDACFGTKVEVIEASGFRRFPRTGVRGKKVR